MTTPSRGTAAGPCRSTSPHRTLSSSRAVAAQLQPGWPEERAGWAARAPASAWRAPRWRRARPCSAAASVPGQRVLCIDHHERRGSWLVEEPLHVSKRDAQAVRQLVGLDPEALHDAGHGRRAPRHGLGCDVLDGRGRQMRLLAPEPQRQRRPVEPPAPRAARSRAPRSQRWRPRGQVGARASLPKLSGVAMAGSVVAVEIADDGSDRVLPHRRRASARRVFLMRSPPSRRWSCPFRSRRSTSPRATLSPTCFSHEPIVPVSMS